MAKSTAHWLTSCIRRDRKSTKPTWDQHEPSGSSGKGRNHHPQTMKGLLQAAQSWEMRVDLARKLQFPFHIVQTSLRPDIVIWSKEVKRVILIELTVP